MANNFNKIEKIKNFVSQKTGWKVAHDFKHAERVYNWALIIARQEKFKDLEIVGAAALLHDIGRSNFKLERTHGQSGAIIAEKFLLKNKLFLDDQIKQIKEAIEFHCTLKKSRYKLVDIVRDADILELLGPIGLMRGYTSNYNLKDYDPDKIKGKTWNFSRNDFKDEWNNSKFIIDQLNWQISCYDNIGTKSAKALAKPLKLYMKKFLIDLEKQVKCWKY